MTAGYKTYKVGDKVICIAGDYTGERGTVISVPDIWYKVKWDRGGLSSINTAYIYESIEPAPQTIQEAAQALVDAKPTSTTSLSPYIANLKAALKRGV
jgi:hypothetical protein